MSLWSRISNALFGERLNSEIEDELQLHMKKPLPWDSTRPSAPHLRFDTAPARDEPQHSRAGWLESLLADTRFGWRQLRRNKVTLWPLWLHWL